MLTMIEELAKAGDVEGIKKIVRARKLKNAARTRKYRDIAKDKEKEIEKV